MTRRAAIVVVSLVVAALVGVGADDRAVVAAAPEADARPRPPGRARDHEAGGAAEGSQADEGRPRAARSRSCATASTGSASPSRRSARRATTRSRSRSRASRIPRPPPRSSARRPSSSSTTSRRASSRRRSTSSGNPVARASVYDLLAGQQALVKGNADQWWLFDKKKKLVVGPVVDQGRRRLRKYDGKLPAGYKLFGTPHGHRRRSRAACRPSSARASADARPATRTTCFKYDPPTVPQMTGADLKLSGTRQDFDTTTQPADRARSSSRRRAATASRRSRGPSTSAASFATRPQHFAIVLDREIRSWPQIDYTDGIARRRHLRRTPRSRASARSRRRRTSRSCSRPAPCPSSSSPSTRPRSRRRSARTR